MSADRNLLYCNFVTYGGRDWFWSLNFNALFYREINSGKIQRVGQFIRRKDSEYNNVILFEEKLIIMPCRARKIMIYDINTDQFRFAEVKIPGIKEDCNLFYGYVTINDLLFMVGNQIPYILKFNMRTEKVEENVNLFPKEERKAYFREVVLDKNELIIPAIDDALIFEVNIETLQWTSKKLSQSESGFSAICKDENSIWLFPKDKGFVLQWYRKENIFLEHQIEEAGYRYIPSKINFHTGIFYNHKIWVFPFCGSCVLAFDLETGEVSKNNAINHYLDTISSVYGECKFRAAQAGSGNIYLLCCCTGKLIIYYPNEDKLVICEKKNEISNADYLECLYEQNFLITREGEFSTEDFVDFIVAHTIEINKMKKQKIINYGFQIYEAVGNS